MITSFHFRGELYTHKKHNFSLKCLYQARRVRVNVYVCKWYPFCLNVSMRFQNCSNSVVFFVFLLDFRTVPTVLHFCFFDRFQNCSNSVVFFAFHFITKTRERIPLYNIQERYINIQERYINFIPLSMIFIFRCGHCSDGVLLALSFP